MFKREIIDERGAIKVIGPNDALEVISKAGSKRAQHYHRSSSHLSYLIYGEIEYYERNVGKKVRPTKLIIKPNQYFYTDPMVEHLMKFTKDSSFICFSFGSREQKDYENDLVRLSFDLEDEYNNWKYELSPDCRFCGETQSRNVIQFSTPLANNLLNSKEEKAEIFPLTVIQCITCGAVQLKEIVNPKLLFSNYLYSSSQSGNLRSHFEKYAKEVTDYCKIKGLVIDVGGNDGVLALPIKNLGYDVINIEPAENLVKISESKDIKTIGAFLCKDTAEMINILYGKASLVTANNVFAHVSNIHEFLAGVTMLLDINGWFVFENAYWLDSINYFSQIYHEHSFYHLVSPLSSLLSCYGLEIRKIERNNQQCGSIRIYCQYSGEKYNELNEEVKKYIQLEKDAGLYQNKTYIELNRRLEVNTIKLHKILYELKNQNKKIAGYSHPAKAVTLLSYFEIGKYLEYIVEDAAFKIGKFSPVENIPIVSRDHFINNPPDICLILAENFEKLIREKNTGFKGKWMVVLPEARIDE